MVDLLPNAHECTQRNAQLVERIFRVSWCLPCWVPGWFRSTVDFLDLDLDLLELGGQVSWAEPLDLSKVQDGP